MEIGVNQERDFAFVVASANRVIKTLSNDPRLAEDFPRAGPGAAMARYVRSLLVEVEEAVRLRAEAASDDLDIESGAQAVRLLNIFVSGNLTRALSWLDDPPRVQLELGARYFIQELAEVIIKEEADLVLVPQVVYSTDPRPFHQWVLKLVESGVQLQLPPGKEPYPLVLNYPELEAHSVLLHPLFAHELGHRALSQEPFVPKVLAPLLTDQGLLQGMREAVAADMPEASDIDVNAEVHVVNEMIGYWLEEMLCDTIACALLGPAYVLSFATVVLSGTNGPGLQHPPANVRVGLILDQLDALGWVTALRSPSFEPSMNRTLDWLIDTSAHDPPTLSPSREFSIDVVRKCAARARTLVWQHLDPFRPEDYLPVHDHLIEMIEARVLPCQLDEQTTGRPGGAIDRRAIVLAGWLHMIGDIGDEPSTLSAALSDEQKPLQAFLTRALEMSRVLEEWTKRS